MSPSLKSFFLYWKTKSDGLGINARLFVTCADLGKSSAETATPSRFPGPIAPERRAMRWRRPPET